MPGIKALVTAISNDVVSSLAAASYPALVDGKILIGRQYQFENSAPPRIIFIPVSSSFEGKDVYNRSNVLPGGGYSSEQLLQIRNGSVLSDMFTFEVRCWGISPTGDPDDDFDYTQVLYQQVIRTIHLTCAGTYTCGKGSWTDSTFTSGQLIRDGREFVFNVTFGTPVLRRLEPMPLAPSNVGMQAEDALILKGVEEVGCEEEPPP